MCLGFWPTRCIGVHDMSLSPLIDGAWEGRLIHLSGVDVIGSTAGSLSRLLQDREAELFGILIRFSLF